MNFSLKIIMVSRHPPVSVQQCAPHFVYSRVSEIGDVRPRFPSNREKMLVKFRTEADGENRRFNMRLFSRACIKHQALKLCICHSGILDVVESSASRKVMARVRGDSLKVVGVVAIAVAGTLVVVWWERCGE